ncbi:4Fe-4S dicluster domain-containing protein [Methanobrevibacter curvatus]|uniref:Hydrogenase-4 component A n=1 Tax=Methanobrevibacter curvatus TaxID=49547 RepID=A0A166A5U6_9EURY|nr:4Fe-4S dicluster domain-containing protein [Methanobrevibacter curvatus]KZX11613.1 hydrogenase-4 component A [Methanobrevibacter curvatus]
MEKLSVQSDLCDGCLDCEKTCSGLYGVSHISIHEIDESYYPISCQHCEDAPCKTICPTDAMDIYGVTADKCIGCGFCVMVCPFGAVSIHSKKAHKCDLCKNTEEGPACVKACSKRAIFVANPDLIIAEKQKVFLNKLSGGSKTKDTGLLGLITSTVRTAKVLNNKD